MNDKTLEFILNLFAYITRNSDKELIKLAEVYVEQFFSRIFGQKIAKTQKDSFVKLLETYRLSSVVYNYRLVSRTINNELPKSQRLQLINYILEYMFFIQKNDILHSQGSETYNFIFDVAKSLKISEETFLNCKKFVADEFYDITDKHNLVYAKQNDPKIAGVKFLQIGNVSGYFIFYNFEETSIILFKYFGSENTTLNSQIIFPRKTYALNSGGVISKLGSPLIYYSDIINKIKGVNNSHIIEIIVENVNFNYTNSSFGIHNLNFVARTGELIGVLGGSGVGKSTLFNILNGNFAPQEGSIKFNGHELQSNKRIIQHHIGFVPQDDSLFERLTVYENLFYTAKLSYTNLPDEEIQNLVNSKLSEFGLWGIRNHRVGTPSQRKISGGQRKRLNIVLEIIRNPKIILVDEPTSGLSTSDSFKIMTLLKEQVQQGCLTIVNIHQPSSDIYRLFDKILILDEGGIMIYFGNPVEAIKHFKTNDHRVDSDVAECFVCKNIRSDEIFDIIEAKKVDEFGTITDARKLSSTEWSMKFVSNLKTTITSNLPNTEVTKIKYIKQLGIFFQRFVLSKLRDIEFSAFAILIPTVLSMVIAFYCKYFSTNDAGNYEYSFYENTNIPIFFLTSIIANIFLGMIQTSDSVIRDVNINKREHFLFLKKSAYYNSKVIFFLLLSLLQSFIYTMISLAIIELKGMAIELWLVLFLMSIIGNIVGLLVSTIFKSISAVYLFVPFLVIPQIIFCGITIPFDKLNYRVTNSEYVPLVGVLTPSMWGVEALLVKQFKDNQYQKPFFKIEMVESQARISTQNLIPKIFKIIEEVKNEQNDTSINLKRINQIKSGLIQLNSPQNLLLDYEKFKMSQSYDFKNTEIFLTKKKNQLEQLLKQSQTKHDSIFSEAMKKYGSHDKLLQLRKTYANKGVESLALSRKELIAFKTIEGALVQVIDPIYKKPNSKIGRTHFMSSVKFFGNFVIETYVFNILVLVLFFIFFYFILVINLFDRIKSFIARNHRKTL